METIMEMGKAKEMGNINLKEALGSLFFLYQFSKLYWWAKLYKI